MPLLQMAQLYRYFGTALLFNAPLYAGEFKVVCSFQMDPVCGIEEAMRTRRGGCDGVAFEPASSKTNGRAAWT
jgi:hypothetical protein